MHVFITPQGRGRRSRSAPLLLPYSCLRALRSSNDTFRLGRILSEGRGVWAAREMLSDLHQRIPPHPVWFLWRYNTCLHVSWSRSNSGYVLSVMADPPHPALGSPQSTEWFEFRKWQIPLDSQQSALCSRPSSPGLVFPFTSFPSRWMTEKVTCFVDVEQKSWRPSQEPLLSPEHKTGQAAFELQFDDLSVYVL